MLITHARPYAKAAFEYAVESKNSSKWLEFLQVLTSLIKDAAIKTHLLNPNIGKNKIVELFIEVIKPLPVGGDNFIRLLVAQRRLSLLPYIAELFAQYCLREAKIEVVEVITAVKLTALQSEKLAIMLQKRFGKSITIENQIDADLLGGALIRTNDLVIDASVKGKLKALAQQIR